MTSELRPALAVWQEAYGVWGDPSLPDTSEADQAAAAVIEADREAVRAEQAREIERLREANQAAAECVAAMMEECARYRNEIRAALAGDSHD